MDELKSKPRDGALFLDQSTQDDPSRYAGDGKAEEAAEILEELINLMDLDVQVDIRSDAERIELDVTGEDSGRVIGKKGAALDALQFLINKMVNRFPEARRHVIVDSGDYRERHDDGLVSMAKRQAHLAVDEGDLRAAVDDPANAEPLREFGRHLGAFLARIMREFDAHAVVIGGGLAGAFHRFGPAMEIPAVPASLGARGPLLGAASLAADGEG